MIQLSSSTETTAQTLFQSLIVGRSRILSTWTSAPWWPVHQRRATMSRVWPPCPSSAFLPFVILGGWRLGCPSLAFVPSFMLSAFCPPLLSWEYFRLLCYSWWIKTTCPFSLASKSFFFFKEEHVICRKLFSGHQQVAAAMTRNMKDGAVKKRTALGSLATSTPTWLFGQLSLPSLSTFISRVL